MEPQTVDRDLALDVMRALSKKDLHWVLKQARRELSARHQAAWALKERVGGAMLGMANVMAGVTWALACRDTLRRSKGHLPTYGKRPASGEMWLPRELLYALRHEVKERGWCPLSAENATQALQHLNAEANRRKGPLPESGYAEFRIRLAGETGIIRVDTDPAAPVRERLH